MKQITLLVIGLYLIGGAFAQSSKNKLSPYMEKKRWGYMNAKKEVVIKNMYDDVTLFKNGYAWVELNGNWGTINEQNEVLVPISYDAYREYAPNVFAVRKQGQWALINEKGTKLSENTYDYMLFPDQNLVPVMKGKLWGVLDYKGNELLPVIFSEVGVRPKDPVNAYKYRYFSEGMIRVKLGNSWGLYNSNGEEVLPINNDYIGRFSHGLAVIENKRKVGYIDPKGTLVIPYQFDVAKDFPTNYDVTMAKKDNKWGIIDLKGNNLTPFQYNSCTGDFRNGYVIVTKDEQRGKLSVTGQESWFPPKQPKIKIPEEEGKNDVKITIPAQQQEDEKAETKEEQPKEEKQPKTKKVKEAKPEKAPKEEEKTEKPAKEKNKKQKKGKETEEAVEEAPQPIIKSNKNERTFDEDGNETGKKKKKKK